MSKKPVVPVCFSIHKGAYDKLTARAKKNGYTRSQLLRFIFDDYLGNKLVKKKKPEGGWEFPLEVDAANRKNAVVMLTVSMNDELEYIASLKKTTRNALMRYVVTQRMNGALIKPKRRKAA